MLDCIQHEQGGWISTPNVHHLRSFTRSAESRRLIDTASCVVADGMPLVWASKLQRTPLPERVAGSNLVWSVARGAAEHGRTIFLLGGEDGVANRAKTKLEERFPSLEIVGTYCPPLGYERDSAEIERIRAGLLASDPDIVYVGLGFPKQERLIVHLRELLPGAWFLGVGISLSFISADQQRAPRWMQVSGLEWLHRLCREPRRLLKRYLLEGIPFTISLLLRSALKSVRASVAGAFRKTARLVD